MQAYCVKMPQEERNEQPQTDQNEEWQTRYPGCLPRLRHKDVPHRQSINVRNRYFKLNIER